MKAIQIVGYEQAVFTDLPMPTPRANELLVRVHRAGICGSDVEVFRQEIGLYRAGRAHLPIIPGHEWAGEVVEMGPEVKGFEIGDRVTGECGMGCGKCWLCQQGLNNICPDRVEMGVFNRDGADAEYATVPYERAHHLYDLTWQEGALIEPCTVGLWIARRGCIGKGDRVLVVGSGTVGIVAAQVAKLFGADLVVVAGRSRFKLNLAGDLGADRTVNLLEHSVEEVTPDLTRGEGFNVVIEAAGTPEGATLALRAAAPRARVIITGVFEAEQQTIDLNTIMPKELTVIGSLGGPLVFDEAVERMRRGELNVKAINTHTLPLSAGPEALAMVARGGPELIKVHLDIAE